MIAQNGNNCVAGAHVFRHSNRASNIDGRRPAHAQRLILQQGVEQGNRLTIGYVVAEIRRKAHKVLSDPPLADAFGHGPAITRKLTSGVIAVQLCAVRVCQADFDVFVLTLQILANTGQGAAGPHSAYKSVNLTVCVSPNLRPSGGNMTFLVGHIVKLVCPECRTWRLCVHLFGQPLAYLDVVAGITEWFCFGFHQGRAEQAQCLFLFITLCLGHRNEGLIAHRVGNQGDPNASVTRRPFNDCGARLYQPFASRLFNDGQSSTVFHGPTGI